MKQVYLHIAIYVCCALIVCGFFVWKLLQQPNNLGIQDWDQHFAFAELVHQSISVYHQMPLWNPYHCGGASLIGFPENEIFSATTLASLLFGTIVGYKVLLGLYLMVGFIGFYLLGQYFQFSIVSTFTMAITYLLSGVFLLPYATGMTNFLSMAFLPYVLLFAIHAFDHSRRYYLILLSLFLAIIFYSGMHYIAIIVFFIALYAGFTAIFQRSLRPIRYLIFCLMLIGLFSAPKLFPSIETAVRYPFVQLEKSSGYSISSLAFSLFSRSQTFEAFNKFPYMSTNFLTGSSYGLDENGMYVGIVPFLLFLLGCIRAYKKHFNLLLLMGVLFIVMLGFNANPSIYAFLKQIPLIGTMRIAQRYHYPAMLIISVFIGYGMQYLTRSHQAVMRISTIALVVFITIDLISVNTKILFTNTFSIPPVTKTFTESITYSCKRSYYDSNGFTTKKSLTSTYSEAYPNLIANIGISRGCYESLSYKESALCPTDTTYRGQYYLLSVNRQITPKYFSPNIIKFTIATDHEDTLIINQNYDPNWIIIASNGYWKAINHDGLLSAAVPPGTTTMAFVYVPVLFIVGTLLTSVTIVILTYLYLHNKKRITQY